jgi:salicylate hydroxylase
MAGMAIVGGGLAGLAAAHALARFGIQAEVFEAAPALGEIGAAVNVAPNATRALVAIGLGEKIAAVANSSPGIYTRNMQTGEFLEFNDRRKTAARYGAPYYTFHRADLLDALASGLDHRLIHLDHRLVGVEERSEGVVLAFANGAKVEAELVIGADGVRSIIRHALYGHDHPTYTGQMVWRALLNRGDVPREVLEPTGHIQWVGPGCHLLAYCIRGEKLVNIVTQEDTDKWVEEGWSTRGDPDEMRLSFPNREPRLEMGPVHAAADGELGPRPYPADRRCGACHAAERRAGCLPGLRGRVYPRSLARRLPQSGRGVRELPPYPYSAGTRGAASLARQCPLQAHARQRGAKGPDHLW